LDAKKIYNQSSIEMERNHKKYDENTLFSENLNPPLNPLPPSPNPYTTGANPYVTGANPYVTGHNPYSDMEFPGAYGANSHELIRNSGTIEIVNPMEFSTSLEIARVLESPETAESIFSRYPPTFSESVISGTFAAVAETLSLHWTTARRFREQLKAPKSSSLRVLYNSLLPDLISMIPITIAQVFFDSLLRQYMLGGGRAHPLSTMERMIAAAGAGFLVSPFPSYAEMLMLLQQKHSMKFFKTITFHWKHYGFTGLGRGLPICAVRDSIYTTAYLGFAPWLSEYCRNIFQDYPSLSRNEHWLPFFIAGPTGGFAAAIVTQPLDCIKSRQQSSPMKLSVRKAGQQILLEDGIKGFFAGMSGRLQRVTLGVIVLSMVNEKVQHALQFRRFYADLEKEKKKK
jgi:hypothetical protein